MYSTDIWISIAKHLSISDIIKMKYLSKQLNKCLNSGKFWDHIYKYKYGHLPISNNLSYQDNCLRLYLTETFLLTNKDNIKFGCDVNSFLKYLQEDLNPDHPVIPIWGFNKDNGLIYPPNLMDNLNKVGIQSHTLELKLAITHNNHMIDWLINCYQNNYFCISPKNGDHVMVLNSRVCYKRMSFVAYYKFIINDDGSYSFKHDYFSYYSSKNEV
jgi:hypothetical protein